MAKIRIVTTRAPGLIPSLIREADRATRPIVLVPESFTLACEAEIVSHSVEKGIFDLQVFSPSSLVREVRDLTGHGHRTPVSADGQNMIVSRVLHHRRDQLRYYRDSVAQPTLARKIAAQINDFTRAGLTVGFLRDYQPTGRRTAAKMADLVLVWEEYVQALGDRFEDAAGQWLSAVGSLPESGLVRNAQLLIYGFDYITHDLLNLARAAGGENGASEIVFGLISDDVGPDRAIFRAASDSVRALTYYLDKEQIAYTLEPQTDFPSFDPGIAWVEKTIYATGTFTTAKVYESSQGRGQPVKQAILRENPWTAKREALNALAQTPVPDLSHVRTYYAKNSYLECQHACQTLIEWRRMGIPWEEMAVAVCDQNTLPSLLPLTLAAAGIPFNAKRDQPILMSAYAQYVLSLLRVLRLNFCQRDVLRLMKTGFTPLSPAEIMDMENYVRKNGIHRNRWLRPFFLPEKESEQQKVQTLEGLRRQLVDPILALKKQLSRRDCTGREAAEALFGFITGAGVYNRLLDQEETFAAQGDDLAIDRNRQVWTAVNELLDSLAAFIGDEPLPLHDLCAMLEASLSARNIKSLPQLSRAVMVAPPQMFFSSGVRCMVVMGLQENEITSSAGVLTEQERELLENWIGQTNRAFYQDRGDPGANPDAPARDQLSRAAPRPFSKIGQSLPDLAARQKQDVYQAVSLAREQLMVSCSGARPSGGVLTPSTAFRRLEKAIQSQKPENATGGLMDADLRPFAPAFALENLAVRLREHREDLSGFLLGPGPEAARWKNALGSLYRSADWRLRTKGVLDGLHVALPVEGLTRQQAERLYSTRGFTISRVETFAACPWRHLMKYGLDLFPAETFDFQPNEQGTFHHDVLQMFLDAAMKLPGWPDLTEQQVNRLLNAVLRERVKKWEGGILRADMVHRFQGAAIIRGVRTAVASLMRAFRQRPHFVPMAAEIPFGMPDAQSSLRLPAVMIQTDDRQTVAFSGRIDRLDQLDLPDGRRYFLVVDHKMSPRDVQQNSVVAGLQLQLPLYLLAAQNGLKGFEPAGALYQPIRDVLIDGGADPGSLQEQIDKALQTSGIILDDKAVQQAAKPLKIARRLETNDTVSAVSAGEMLALEGSSLSVITGKVNRIRAGETAPAPLQDGRESPCTMCEARDACPYDPSLPGFRVRELSHKRRMALSSLSE